MQFTHKINVFSFNLCTKITHVQPNFIILSEMKYQDIVENFMPRIKGKSSQWLFHCRILEMASLWHLKFWSQSAHHPGRNHCEAECSSSSSLAVCLCLLLGIRHPGSWLERVPSAGGLLADLLLAEAGGGGVALGQGLCRSCHQTLLVLFSLQEQIFLLGLLGLHLDLLPVGLVLQQLLHNTEHRQCVHLCMASAGLLIIQTRRRDMHLS